MCRSYGPLPNLRRLTLGNLFSGRCEQTIGNSFGEIEATVQVNFFAVFFSENQASFSIWDKNKLFETGSVMVMYYWVDFRETQLVVHRLACEVGPSRFSTWLCSVPVPNYR
jgi:hypothetical protein